MERNGKHQENDGKHQSENYGKLAERLASGGRVYERVIMVGQCAGIFFALSGVILALLGISGAVEFVFEATTIKARLSNASPGVVIAAMGMVIIWRYKPKMSHDVELGSDGLKSRGDAP